MYKSLKQGWVPLSDLTRKYSVSNSKVSRNMKLINTKDKIGNQYIVRETEFVETFVKK